MNLSFKSVLKYTTAISGIIFLVSFTSCKKSTTPEPTLDADVRDSAYFNSLIYYLWNDKLPDYNNWLAESNASKDLVLLSNDKTTFKPRSFADVFALMGGANGIKAYSARNAQGNPLDRYSFAATQQEWDNVASGSNEGFGFSRSYLNDNDLRVGFVFDQSPMGRAGVQRGWQILRVNNIAGTAANDQAIFNALRNNTSVTFEFRKNDGTTQTIPLTKAAYKANFLLHKSVIETGNKKIGYFVLNDFLGDQNGQATLQQLETTFNEFKTQGVNELVVDLRYNGGGYVFLSEALANLIAPASAKGRTMYSYRYNQLLTEAFTARNRDNNPNNNVPVSFNYNTTAPVLNLTKVVFITTEATASASELLINNLKPYLNVKLVGNKTNGKPVGFPALLIEMSQTDPSKNYYVFPIAFQTVNANNQGDYYDGIEVDKRQIDDLSRNFGDPNEACLKEAISYITTGSFTNTGPVRLGIIESPAMQRAKQNKLAEEYPVSDMFVSEKTFRNLVPVIK